VPGRQPKDHCSGASSVCQRPIRSMPTSRSTITPTGNKRRQCPLITNRAFPSTDPSNPVSHGVVTTTVTSSTETAFGTPGPGLFDFASEYNHGIWDPGRDLAAPNLTDHVGAGRKPASRSTRTVGQPSTRRRPAAYRQPDPMRRRERRRDAQV
jgi:hypothetical protein